MEYLNPNTSYIDVSYYRNLDFVQKHAIPKEYVWVYDPVNRDVVMISF